MAQRRGWVKRLLRRWLPVDQGWSMRKPDHAYYIRPDGAPCCEWHDEHAFHVVAQPQRDHSDDPGWSAQKADYFRERFG